MPDEYPLDCRSGFDKRVVWALRMVGVNLLEHCWCSGRRAGHRIKFTYRGSAEMAKGVITDLIHDEYNGTEVRFYASRHNQIECYAMFTEGRFDRDQEAQTYTR